MIVTAHVFGVWLHRYAWEFDQAVHNGYGKFLIFQTALLAINASLFMQDRYSVLLHRVVFAIVFMGAIGATFRYEVVAIYRVPVLLNLR